MNSANIHSTIRRVNALNRVLQRQVINSNKLLLSVKYCSSNVQVNKTSASDGVKLGRKLKVHCFLTILWMRLIFWFCIHNIHNTYACKSNRLLLNTSGMDWLGIFYINHTLTLLALGSIPSEANKLGIEIIWETCSGIPSGTLVLTQHLNEKNSISSCPLEESILWVKQVCKWWSLAVIIV